MPKATDVYCLHCEQYISRSRERAHHAAYHTPLMPTLPRPPSKLRRVFDMESEGSVELRMPEMNMEQGLHMCQ
jgi:hypothetical protein